MRTERAYALLKLKARNDELNSPVFDLVTEFNVALFLGSKGLLHF